MIYPFEVSYEEVEAHIETYVSAVFSCLESEFLVMPKGDGFVDYRDFEMAYEALKKETADFTRIDSVQIMDLTIRHPMVLLVIRSILGVSPPEWAYLASARASVEITQGFIRSLDRGIRMAQNKPLICSGLRAERIRALVDSACFLIEKGPELVLQNQLHRFEKADTTSGWDSVRSMARLGVPYAMLLYERLLGRPFASHRDSVSELIGGALETAIEDSLTIAGVSYRKTGRAEKLAGFDQAPDFVIPSEFNPKIVIEAKVTEDDGTARDKVTRVQHLASLSKDSAGRGEPFEVVACIGGRGFGVRREDMKKLIRATHGKVFTLKTFDRLVDCTGISGFRSR